MKILVSIVFGLLSVPALAQQNLDDFTIGFGRAGPISLDARALEIVENVRRDQSTSVDLEIGTEYGTALMLSLPGSSMTNGLIAELVNAGGQLSVWRIHVHDPAMRTSEGVGVGSSVGELRNFYEIDRVGSDEGHLCATVAELSACFELDLSRYGHERLWSIPDPDAIPEDVEIVSIHLSKSRIYSDP